MIARLTALMSPGKLRARHVNLIFHRVLPVADPLLPDEPDHAWFARLIAMLARRYNVLSLAEAIDAAAQATLPRASLSITFDDGYADNYTEALPILREHGVPATFFIATGYLDGGRMWNDSVIETVRQLADGEHDLSEFAMGVVVICGMDTRRQLVSRLLAAWKHLPAMQRQQRVDAFSERAQNLPSRLMMTRAQLRDLADQPGMEIGAHTRSHPILAAQDPAAAYADIVTGRDDLREILGSTPRLFAYPNGKPGRDYGPEHAAMVRKLGFRAAVATRWGAMTSTTDPFNIPRFTPWRRNLTRFSIDLLRCRYGLIRD